MNTNQIKKFAIEARNILKRGVAAKITTLGFDAKGQVSESLKPQLMQGGTLWKGELYAEGFYKQWMALYHRVQQKGILDVYEEAAYTWFNRLTAIRILQKNRLCEPMLVYTDAARTPRIVDEARMGRLPQMPDETRRHLMELLEDDTKVTEQFAVLVTAWCHANPIMQACFGSDDDYTELLLPSNILAEGGFVDLLNHTDFITDDDFRSPELIGWLYQFYISERKDEVFAKKGKFEADEIPAATQIFTPNWIVKYMVQNTVGRIYLDNNPGTKTFTDKWKYLVDQKPTPSEDIYHYDELTDIKVADLACGSGHILNECFDILYDLYIYEGYSRSEAIENIFEHNLTGIDIDNRAKQLATFALMIKACQKDEHFVDAHCLPKVLTMPNDCNTNTWEELNGHLCAALGLPANSPKVKKEMADAFTLLQDAENLGSIMKFDISEETRVFMLSAIREMPKHLEYEENFKDIIAGFKIILALTDKYAALVMNPPYMGGGNMNNVLSKYVKDNYEIGKADLATVFVQHMADMTYEHGKYGFIIPPSWMFLSTFENLRRDIIDNRTIDSLLHLSRGVFGADFGASSAVISNTKSDNAKGTYFRLIERTFQEFDQKHLQLLFEKTLANHDFRYYFADYTKEVDDIVYSEKGAKIYYPNIPQSNFEKIPGCPIGYWASEKMINIFKEEPITKYSSPRKGNSTSNNNRFLRLWYEVSQLNAGYNYKSVASFLKDGKRWLPYNKGGGIRKWYGYNENLIDWNNNASEIRSIPTSVITNEQYYMQPGLTWSTISSKSFGVRFFENGFIFDNGGCCLFNLNEYREYIAGLLNSKVLSMILSTISPTVNFQSGDISKMPIRLHSNNIILNAVRECYKYSRLDWDAHETSWDFQTNEIVALDSEEKYVNTMQEIFEGTGILADLAAPELDSLEWRTNIIKQKWEDKFMRLHANEEELNRQFIEIYGLQDELTPDVSLSEITILQQGEISIEENNDNKESNE